MIPKIPKKIKLKSVRMSDDDEKILEGRSPYSAKLKQVDALIEDAENRHDASLVPIEEKLKKYRETLIVLHNEDRKTHTIGETLKGWVVGSAKDSDAPTGTDRATERFGQMISKGAFRKMGLDSDLATAKRALGHLSKEDESALKMGLDYQEAQSEAALQRAQAESEKLRGAERKRGKGDADTLPDDYQW